MHFDNLFRLFFGPSFSSTGSYEDIDLQNQDHSNNKLFSDSSQSNTEFEQLDQMMMKLLQESFLIFQDPPAYKEKIMSPNHPATGSLRDQMLKPGFIDKLQKGGWESERSTKTDVDLDEAMKNDGNQNALVPKIRDNGMHYSTRSTMKYFHNSNGATESRSTANDREGCLREIITKEFNGKKYVMEKRQCPGAPPQTTETFVNLTMEELPEFFKNWKIDDSPGNQNTFKPV